VARGSTKSTAPGAFGNAGSTSAAALDKQLKAKNIAATASIDAAAGKFRYFTIQFSQRRPPTGLPHNPLIIRPKTDLAFSKMAVLSSLKLEYPQERP
ncbi:MAG: hypothetical protein KAI41_06210, partial [Hyphomicrobiaceae bacterium]|nr:hypothetical protein [Hyphomicrobiaceae bacterium]